MNCLHVDVMVEDKVPSIRVDAGFDTNNEVVFGLLDQSWGVVEIILCLKVIVDLQDTLLVASGQED
jgi:hypothetical protein